MNYDIEHIETDAKLSHRKDNTSFTMLQTN